MKLKQSLVLSHRLASEYQGYSHANTGFLLDDLVNVSLCISSLT
jgi:hypothetical protein